jgi:hypothetical protein
VQADIEASNGVIHAIDKVLVWVAPTEKLKLLNKWGVYNLCCFWS